MQKYLIVAICLLFVLIGSALADNFKALMKKQGFTLTPSLNANGFLCYKKLNTLFFMRDCDGYCCEGFVVADLLSKEFKSSVIWLYGSLQNTLEWKGRSFIDPSKMANRVEGLIKQVFENLKLIDQIKHGNRTEFVYDYLNVRGEFYAVSEKDLKTGKGPTVLIKLWIP